MLKYLFVFITLVHAIIHYMGFAKAFNYGSINQITQYISKPAGTIWLISGTLFIATILLFLFKRESWPYVAIVAIIISQLLVFSVWRDAKFGTFANVIVLLVAIVAWASQHFESNFRADVKSDLAKMAIAQADLLTESDLQFLPLPVQKYLRYCGVVNKPKVKNMKVVFDGQMREKGKDWFTFQSVQYNFFDDPARFFFMKAMMYGTTVPGYHRYQQATATMQIKLLGLFNVVNVKGTEMNKAETVTVFNDMCLMAPATLIDKSIVWTSVDSLSTKATYINGVNKITAMLYFNEQGQLINFVSDDRYAIDMNQYRFSTPVTKYLQIDGRNVLQYGETVWDYPEAKFVYGKFTLKSIEYNVSEFKP